MIRLIFVSRRCTQNRIYYTAQNLSAIDGKALYEAEQVDHKKMWFKTAENIFIFFSKLNHY